MLTSCQYKCHTQQTISITSIAKVYSYLVKSWFKFISSHNVDCRMSLSKVKSQICKIFVKNAFYLTLRNFTMTEILLLRICDRFPSYAIPIARIGYYKMQYKPYYRQSRYPSLPSFCHFDKIFLHCTNEGLSG